VVAKDHPRTKIESTCADAGPKDWHDLCAAESAHTLAGRASRGSKLVCTLSIAKVPASMRISFSANLEIPAKGPAYDRKGRPSKSE
jgi:hypothetical protein